MPRGVREVEKKAVEEATFAAGAREAVEDAVISTVNDNYAGVYHGVREGYSG